MKSSNRKPWGVFVFVYNSKEEHKLLKRCMKELRVENQIVACYNGQEALNYLKDTDDQIFMIMTDVTMPKMDGLELKRIIELTPELKTKSIPFFYHTDVELHAVVKTAYNFGIQGYFKRTDDPEDTLENLRYIIDFWTRVVHPKNLI